MLKDGYAMHSQNKLYMSEKDLDISFQNQVKTKQNMRWELKCYFSSTENMLGIVEKWFGNTLLILGDDSDPLLVT